VRWAEEERREAIRGGARNGGRGSAVARCGGGDGRAPSKSRNNPRGFFRNLNNFFKTIDFFFWKLCLILYYYPQPLSV